MKKLVFSALLLGFAAALTNACTYQTAELLYPKANLANCDSTVFSYSKIVAPMMQESCVSCHSNGNVSGGVNLQDYQNTAIWAKNGKLYNSISHNGIASKMPQGGAKLADCKVLLVKKWVEAGFPNN
jgi:mono/diheme cytochrome c family protein